MNIRQAIPDDAAGICRIYNHYVLNTTITFETAVVESTEMAERIREKIARFDWIVGENEGTLIGYACYGTFRTRAAYFRTVESTIILDKDYTGRGFGGTLYRCLIESARRRGFHEMIAVIALPNPESVNLHRKSGFVEAGVLKNVGYKFERFLDTGLWQLSLVRENS
jgi:L-amino acid N-acyltransferase YncA